MGWWVDKEADWEVMGKSEDLGGLKVVWVYFTFASKVEFDVAVWNARRTFRGRRGEKIQGVEGAWDWGKSSKGSVGDGVGGMGGVLTDETDGMGWGGGEGRGVRGGLIHSYRLLTREWESENEVASYETSAASQYPQPPIQPHFHHKCLNDRFFGFSDINKEENANIYFW